MFILDERVCKLCNVEGDGRVDGESRLLYCGVGEWIHVNCSLWSSEVYEDNNGSLMNVASAIARGMRIKCSLCRKKGATVGCCDSECRYTFHFRCAIKVNKI